MTTCPFCSHNLLDHLRSHDRYWYCQHCRSETSASFITAQNKAILHKSLLLNRDHPCDMATPRPSSVAVNSFI